MDLLAFKNLSQLLAIQPCAGGTLGSVLLPSASSPSMAQDSVCWRP